MSTTPPICSGGPIRGWRCPSGRAALSTSSRITGSDPNRSSGSHTASEELLVKLILRAANELNNPKWEPLARQTRGVAFRNAAYGSVAWKRRKSAQDANERERRKANEAHLLDLAAWYTRNAARLGIRTEAYYEKGTVRGLKVVDKSSADPRVPDCMPVPSNANHMDICKPRNARDPVYMGVRNFVESFVPATVPLTGDRAPAPLDHNINTVFGMHRATRCTTCRGRGSTML